MFYALHDLRSGCSSSSGHQEATHEMGNRYSGANLEPRDDHGGMRALQLFFPCILNVSQLNLQLSLRSDRRSSKDKNDGDNAH